MSQATWRQFFSYSKYTQVAARAVRQSLKETERADAERRAFQALRYQEWKNGEASDHISLAPAQSK
ncbi:F-type H+-transporting ATPase subunit epsilon [Malassezia restricta]|uniref:F-type H+-transporting ATPase subunit epsilon n=1 Tax=Malassezia restricta TaxID=76775 RepID=UPI000DD1265D|nr:F-type H+-transporting ATPase subunit epsilon [Malassezia restricta]AXA49081.1 F-type H+-transporting ATPase subunit epsilon [Malassezia restricta]